MIKQIYSVAAEATAYKTNSWKCMILREPGEVGLGILNFLF